MERSAKRLTMVFSALAATGCMLVAMACVAKAVEPAPDGSCSSGCVDIHGTPVSCGLPMGSCAQSNGSPGGTPNGDCQFGEQCDDGNTVNGDGCDNNCTFSLAGPTGAGPGPNCGNGISIAGEECDNGALNDDVNLGIGGNPCDTHCRLKSCGNGRVEGGEQCDDGDTLCDDDCDSCRNGFKGNCLFPGCGNGITDAEEQCDSGTNMPGSGCDPGCKLPSCGNGIVDPGEQCDDGNIINGDACEDDCTLPRCGNGITDPGEQCDDGSTAANTATCDINCLTPFCGNGVVDGPGEYPGEVAGGETCDDGNTVNGDTCDSNCTLPACGNGVTGAGEQCDDGNTLNGDTCEENCTLATCGNGITDPNEQCDSGECVCDVSPTRFSFGRDCGTVDGRDECQTEGGTCVSSIKGGGFPACSVFVNHAVDTCVACGNVAGDGNSDYTPDACRDDCQPADCGDGVTDTGEGCDDGLINPASPGLGDDIDECPNGPTARAFGFACKMANVCGDGLPKFPSETDPNCQGPLCAQSVPTTQACDNGGNTIQLISGPYPALKTCFGNPFIRCADEVDCVDQGTVGPCGNSTSPVANDACTGPGTSTVGAAACCTGPQTGTCTAPEPGQCRGQTCTLPACGDGITDPGEGCDDGNTVNGDGCQSNCRLPSCGDGTKQPPEACDDGGSNGINKPCTDTCQVAVCGDGKTCSASGCTTGPHGGVEQCDDGNFNSFDNCKNDCSLNVCGDGVTHSSGTAPFEQCDDGNNVSFDGCSANCCLEPNGAMPHGSQDMFSGQQCNLTDMAAVFTALARSTTAGAAASRVVNTLNSRTQQVSKIVSQAKALDASLQQPAGRQLSHRKLCQLEKRAQNLLVRLQRTLDTALVHQEMPYDQYAAASANRLDAMGFATQIKETFFCEQ